MSYSVYSSSSRDLIRELRLDVENLGYAVRFLDEKVSEKVSSGSPAFAGDIGGSLHGQLLTALSGFHDRLCLCLRKLDQTESKSLSL